MLFCSPINNRVREGGGFQENKRNARDGHKGRWCALENGERRTETGTRGKRATGKALCRAA